MCSESTLCSEEEGEEEEGGNKEAINHQQTTNNKETYAKSYMKMSPTSHGRGPPTFFARMPTRGRVLQERAPPPKFGLGNS